MPTVPTSFVPQVSPQGDGGIVPLQAPPVEGVRNALPEQQIRFGEAMRGAGNVSFRIGQQLQDSIDEAAAKAADVELSQFSNNILRGKDGYLGLQGKDADTRYEETNSAILSAANGIQSRLKNKTQVELFNQSASRNIVQFQGQMGAHWNNEVPKYLAMESNARAIQSSQDAINLRSFSDAGYVESTAKAKAETAKGLSYLGIYEGSAQYDQSMKKVSSGITAGVVSRLMDENSYQEGLYYLEEQNKSKLIDEPTYQSLRSGLIANRDRQMAIELTDNIRKTGQLITNAGTGNYLAPVLGGEVVRFSENEYSTKDKETFKSGLTLKVSSGTQVKSPGRCTVEDYTEGSNTVILKNEDGSRFNFEGIVPLNIKQGDQISRGQIIGTAMDDKKELGKATLTYSFVKNGVVKNPSNTNVLVDNVDRPKTNTLQDQLALADQIPDSEMRGRVRSLLKQEYAQDAAIYKDAYNDLKFQIYNMYAAGTEIPKKMLASLNPEDQKEFDAKKLESSSLDAKLAIAEAGGANQDLLIQYGTKLTKQDRLVYLNQMNTAGSSPASFDQDTFSLLLRQNGFEELDNPKGDKDKLKALQIRDAVNTRIQMQKESTGKNPSFKEKQEIMMRILTDKSYVPGGWFTDSNVADVLLTKKQRESAYKNVLGRKVPIEKYEEITNILAGQKAEITEENILKMLEGSK
jgi:murein DD-endopeptidase MepM/ murein hydrolase activator NlpD